MFIWNFLARLCVRSRNKNGKIVLKLSNVPEDFVVWCPSRACVLTYEMAFGDHAPSGKSKMATSNSYIFSTLEKFSDGDGTKLNAFLSKFDRCCLVANKVDAENAPVKGQLLMLYLAVYNWWIYTQTP